MLSTPLPALESSTHWIVGSAGRKSFGKTLPSRDLPSTVHGPLVKVAGHGNLLKVKGRNVLLAVARKSKKNGGALRDLRHVANSTACALEVAATQGATTVSLMMLSASTSHGRWPRVFSLIEMLRGIREYGGRRHRHTPLHVIIHDTAAARTDDPSTAAWHAIESGKLDPAEVLDCEALRFFVEIHLSGGITRMPVYILGTKSVAQVGLFLGLTEGWDVTVDPNPAPRDEFAPIGPHQSLLDAGVVPGSTLRFVRP